jgi:hypothetical protein
MMMMIMMIKTEWRQWSSGKDRWRDKVKGGAVIEGKG